MGEIYEPHVCRGCPNIGGSVTHRGWPFGPLCDRCWDDTQTLAEHDQAIADGADAPPPPAPAHCPDCGRPQDRRQTGYGHWVLLEPRMPLPTKVVPDGQRWLIRPDGRAVNWSTGPPPDHNCRIPHRLVCPAGPRPDHLAPIIAAIWEHNRGQQDPAA